MNYANALVALAAIAAATAAQADVRYIEVPVEHVEPIVERVRHVEPEERCWFEEVEHRHAVRHRAAAVPVVGAILGGALGHAMGHKKRNKQVGAVVGAVLGGAIAHDAVHDARRHAPRRTRVARQEVCDVVNRVKREERVTGYMATYRYAGKTYRSRVTRHPGDSIRVRVQITPA